MSERSRSRSFASRLAGSSGGAIDRALHSSLRCGLKEEHRLSRLLVLLSAMGISPLVRIWHQFFLQEAHLPLALMVVANRVGCLLLTIINDILDFSKIESDMLELENVTFSLDELLTDCCAVFSLAAERKHIGLISSVDPRAPNALRGDPSRLRQILLNLLGNAFKFTSQGNIRLRSSALAPRDARDDSSRRTRPPPEDSRVPGSTCPACPSSPSRLP